jgi:hypothetical protein
MMMTHIAAGNASSLRRAHCAHLRPRPVGEFRAIAFEAGLCTVKVSI